MYNSGNNKSSLLPEFEKDLAEENLLETINQHLAEIEPQDRLPSEQHSTIFIVGSPRSGTTLASQIVASEFDVSFVNSVAAAFYLSPTIGLRLANKLLGTTFYSSFESRYARSSDVTEPHEFGYFWAHHLGYKHLMQPSACEIEKIEWEKLDRVLWNMAAVSGRNFLFKPLMAVWYIREFLKNIPSCYFIRIRRDPVQVAASILKMRMDMTGSYNSWVSLRPACYGRMSGSHPYEQVAAQVAAIECELEQHEGNARVLVVEYDKLCSDMDSVLDDIGSRTPLVMRSDCSDSRSVNRSIERRSHNRSDLPNFKFLEQCVEDAFLESRM